MLNTKQLGKGCFDAGIKSYDIAFLNFKICPGNLYNSYINYIWELFTHYQNNLLPYSGNIGQQPAKIIEIFDVIQGLVSEYENRLKKVKSLKDQADQRLGNGR